MSTRKPDRPGTNRALKSAAPIAWLLAGLGSVLLIIRLGQRSPSGASTPRTELRTYPLKRLLDLAGTSVGLVLLLPAILIIAAAIRVALGAPILFRQQRPGLHGQPFMLYKFRTMTDARDSAGTLLPDEQRLTRFGRWLRSTSLDELPELLNVLRSEMSLVGPRPLLIQYLDRYTPEQARRHETRPGITGWAQINGRNAISWEERFKLDVWYVDHQSLLLDIRILVLTVWKVLKREGISQNGQITMTEFQGTVEETPV